MSNQIEEYSVGVKIAVREWELNENSTTYDRLVAAPSDETMATQWILFVTILTLSLLLMIFVFISTLRDKSTRRNSFNTYILFLLGPDILFNMCCILSCGLNVQVGRYISVDGCVFQSLYIMFAVTSSAWINAIAAYQLHRMLKCSRKALRYHPPTRRQVTTHCLSVYVFSIFMATWSNWGQESWWPIRNNVYSGVFCLPMPFDTKSTLFFYLLYAPLVFFLPFFYICYVVADMIYNKLLPHRNQRKTLMVFLRLLLVYFVMWVPALGLVFVGGNWLSTWWVFFGAVWAHLQGAVSAAICLFKPDIQRACQKSLRTVLFCCRCCLANNPNDNDLTSRHGTDKIPSNSSSYEEDPAIKGGDTHNHFDRSCELELSLRVSEDDMALEDTTDGKARENGRSSDSGDISGGRVGSKSSQNPSAYEVSMGLEAGTLHTIPSPQQAVNENVQETSV